MHCPCRNINFVTHGFGAPVNYTAAGPLGNQFASPFGSPYRVQSVNGIGDVFGSIATSLGKIATPLLPALAPIAGVAVSSLLTPKGTVTSTPTQQSRMDTVTVQATADQAAAAAQKKNESTYLIVGGVALLALFYFMSKRK